MKKPRPLVGGGLCDGKFEVERIGCIAHTVRFAEIYLRVPAETIVKAVEKFSNPRY